MSADAQRRSISRGRRLAMLSIALVSVTATLVPTPSAAFGFRTRTEVVDESWLVGNLTWESDQGHVTWGAAPDGPSLGGSAGPVPGAVEFSSQPLQHDLYLDPSHLVQIELLVAKGSSNPLCGGYSSTQLVMVNITAGSKAIVRAWGASSITSSATFPTPPPVAGYVRCPYRVPIEAAFVPANSILVVRVDFIGQATFQIGTNASAPSIVRIPTFSPEEARYRMPELFVRVRRPAPVASDAAPQVLATLAALPLLLRRPRRQMAPLVVLLMLAPAWAGCLGARPASTVVPTVAGPQGTGEVQYETTTDERLADEGSGTILGQVSDRYGYPVQDAFVALLGSTFSARADENGVFSMRSVPIGSYTLRADAELFRSIELPVRVNAFQVAQVDMVLDYDDSVAAKDRPHPHDYWEGETEATIFRAPLHRQACPTSAPRCALWDEFYVPPDAPVHGLIRPGTSEVRVTLDFKAETACFTTMGLAIQDNSDANPNNWTFYAPRPSGEAFHLQAAWETTDVGHQTFSTWTFAAFGVHPACSDPTLGVLDAAKARPGVVVDEAAITIVRGALPLEPAHPDRWNGETTLRVLPAASWADPVCMLAAITPFSAGAVAFFEAGCAAFLAACLASDSGVDPGNEVVRKTVEDYALIAAKDLGPPALVVPPETARVEVVVHQNKGHGVGGTDVGRAYGWELWYKTGDTQMEAYRRASSVFHVAPTPSVTSPPLPALNQTWRWEIPVTDTQSDSMYAKKSAWRFALVPTDWKARCAYMYANGQLGDVALAVGVAGRPDLSPILYGTMDVFAHRPTVAAA